MKQSLTDYYDQNIALLKKTQPLAWETIKNSPPEPIGEICHAADGRPNLKVISNTGSTVYLHNKEKPQLDGLHVLQDVPQEMNGTVVMYGMGLGYGPLMLIRERPDMRHLVIFELNPGIFIQALHAIDLSILLSDHRLILSIGEAPDIDRILLPTVPNLQTECSCIIAHQPSLSLNIGAYRDLSENVYERVSYHNVNGNTALQQGNRVFSNCFSHLRSIHHNSLLGNLQNAFKGTPAILVAGGPSLDKNIHLLKKAKNKAVIFSVDTALPAVLLQGVTPDFTCTLDSQAITHEKLADVAPQATGTSLIYHMTANTRTPKIFPAEHLLWTTTDNKPIYNWINGLVGGKTLTAATASVAHINMTSAILMGCAPIILIGQDLAFTGFKDHATHTVLSLGINSAEDLKKKNGITETNGTGGGKVYTDRGLLFLKTQLEKIIKDHPGHYINATEGGAHIEGTEVLTLQKALSKYCKEPLDIHGQIQSLLKGAKTDPTKLLDEFRNTLKKVQKIQETITKANQMTKGARQEIDRLQKKGTRCRGHEELPRKLQEKILAINRLQEAIAEPKEIWQLLSDITFPGLRTTERLKQDMAKLQGIPEKHLELLLKSLKRITASNNVQLQAADIFKSHLQEVLGHHKTEKELLKATQKDQTAQSILKLAQFYIDTKEYLLAKPLLETLLASQPRSAEPHFHLGCIATLQADYEKAEKYFSTAIELDHTYKQNISNFRVELGDYYFNLWKAYSGQINLLKKGLRYCPDHPKLKADLALEEIKQIHRSPDPHKADKLIEDWHRNLEKNNHRKTGAALTPEQTAEFYTLYGQLAMRQSRLSEAVKSFHQVLEIFPDNPENHIHLTEAFFSKGDFDQGLGHLNKAVQLDKNYAKYWEEIGDQSQKDGNHQDAIAAYEQYLMALPQNILILRKIGDSYRAMGQLEDAQKIYTLLKDQLERPITGS